MLSVKLVTFLFALQMLGVKRIERVLPTGTPLTVVGEVKCYFWVAYMPI